MGNKGCLFKSLTLRCCAFVRTCPWMIHMNGAVPDLLHMALRYLMGTQCGAKDISAYQWRSVCLTVMCNDCVLGRWWHVETSLFSGFTRDVREEAAGAIPSCRSLLGGSRLGKSKVVHLLPQDTGRDRHRLRFTPWFVLPICKIGV